jgi:CRP-like cAMP-binding protein
MNKSVQHKLDGFFSQYKTSKYKKGEILIRADEAPSGIFYLIKGMVKQYSISHQGDEQVLTIYKPGSFFPMMWAINDTLNTYYFEAIDNIEVKRVGKDEVISFIKGEPDVLYDLVSRLYKGMSGLLSRIEYLMFGSAYHRVIFTIINAAYRFGEKNDDTSKVKLMITHKEIASFSGLTKETISRESHKLQKKGLIENKNKTIIINDIKKLEEELIVH